MPASSASSVVRFGSFEFDVLSRELRRSGMRVNLQDQPLRVLECLLERPGQLVSREDLRHRLWSGDTFVDFEQGVNAAVRRLRETWPIPRSHLASSRLCRGGGIDSSRP